MEEVLMLMRLLGGGGVPARAVDGEVRGQWAVLETKHMKKKMYVCSTNGPWVPVGQLHKHVQ